MKLSIAMIVKNEEKYLDKCLKALLPITKKISSEIIILDTGSTDATKSIAKKYTENIYDYVWENDFSKARNKSIEYSKGEWILVVDGDEVLENPNEIVKFFEKKIYMKYNAATVDIKSFNFSEEEGYAICPIPRLFKKKKDLYKGAIHEQPQYSAPVVRLTACFKHYGYSTTDLDFIEKKFYRNQEILKKELINTDDRKYVLFQIAQNYNLINDSESSLISIKEAYLEAKRLKSNDSYIYQLYIKLLYEYSLYDDCIKIIEEALEVRRDHIDYFYYLGFCYYSKQEYIKSKDAFEKYLFYLNNLENNNSYKDITLVIYTKGNIDNVTLTLSSLENKIGNYNKSIELYENSKNNNLKLSYFSIYLDSLIASKNYDKLLSEAKNENNNKDIFISTLENSLKTMYMYEKENILKTLKDVENDIGLYINIKDNFIKEDWNDNNILNKISQISYFKINLISIYSLRYLIYGNSNSLFKLEAINNIISKDLLKAACSNNLLLVNSLKNLIITRQFSDKKEELKVIVEIEKFLLDIPNLTDEEYLNIFEQYLRDSNKLVQLIYGDSYRDLNIDSFEIESVNEFLDLYKLISTNKLEFVRKLNFILSKNEQYRRIIKIYKDKIEVYDKYVNAFKEKELLLGNIESLVNQGSFIEALKILNETIELIPFDSDILNALGVVAYYMNDKNNALRYFNRSLLLDPNNKDAAINVQSLKE